MKIGDLVRYFGDGCFGIIVDCDDPDCKTPEFYVLWIGIGDGEAYEWRFADELVVVHEGR